MERVHTPVIAGTFRSCGMFCAATRLLRLVYGQFTSVSHCQKRLDLAGCSTVEATSVRVRSCVSLQHRRSTVTIRSNLTVHDSG